MAFESDLKRIKHKIKSRLVNDKIFAAKFLFAIDSRLQLRMEDCRMATDRSEVDGSILSLSKITRDILHNRFAINLPPSFKEVNSEEVSNSNNKRKG